jgi:hypothetical protein
VADSLENLLALQAGLLAAQEKLAETEKLSAGYAKRVLKEQGLVKVLEEKFAAAKANFGKK